MDDDRLSVLAKRLRDLLVGDVVRGVEVGLDGDDGVMARAGALEAINLGWSTLGSVLGIDPEMMRENDGPVSRDLGSGIRPTADSMLHDGATDGQLRRVASRQALHISIRYESALCTALLLPQLDEEEDGDLGGESATDVGRADMIHEEPPYSDQPATPDHFRNLPLLLFRMPTPLRSVIIDFLSSTFDCRISPLRLGTQTLLTNLERWVAVSKLTGGPAAAKDVVLTLGFSMTISGKPDPKTDGPQTAGLGLKSIDAILSPSELHKFRDVGMRSQPSDTSSRLKRKFVWREDGVKRRKVDAHIIEEGWDWRANMGGQSDPATSRLASFPFTEALGTYFDEHLALNLFDSRTRILRVACGGFVMSESRLKLLSSSEPDSDGGPRRGLSMAQIQAVADCLGDLLDRAMARSRSTFT